jgi:hypothetical protein
MAKKKADDVRRRLTAFYDALRLNNVPPAVVEAVQHFVDGQSPIFFFYASQLYVPYHSNL